MALMTVDERRNRRLPFQASMVSRRKMDVVLRLLRGEKLEELSRELSVEAHRIAAWRDEFLDAGKEGLKGNGEPALRRTAASETPSARSAS